MLYSGIGSEVFGLCQLHNMSSVGSLSFKTGALRGTVLLLSIKMRAVKHQLTDSDTTFDRTFKSNYHPTNLSLMTNVQENAWVLILVCWPILSRKCSVLF